MGCTYSGAAVGLVPALDLCKGGTAACVGAGRGLARGSAKEGVSETPFARPFLGPILGEMDPFERPFERPFELPVNRPKLGPDPQINSVDKKHLAGGVRGTPPRSGVVLRAPPHQFRKPVARPAGGARRRERVRGRKSKKTIAKMGPQTGPFGDHQRPFERSFERPFELPVNRPP